MATRVNVRAVRDALGLGRADFAALFPVDKRTVRRWENGEVDPSPLAYQKLCAIRQQGASPEPEASSEPRRPSLSSK